MADIPGARCGNIKKSVNAAIAEIPDIDGKEIDTVKGDSRICHTYVMTKASIK